MCPPFCPSPAFDHIRDTKYAALKWAPSQPLPSLSVSLLSLSLSLWYSLGHLLVAQGLCSFALVSPLSCLSLLSYFLFLFLTLFLHDVCYSESCIYRSNGVRSKRGFVGFLHPKTTKMSLVFLIFSNFFIFMLPAGRASPEGSRSNYAYNSWLLNFSPLFRSPAVPYTTLTASINHPVRQLCFYLPPTLSTPWRRREGLGIAHQELHWLRFWGMGNVKALYECLPSFPLASSPFAVVTQHPHLLHFAPHLFFFLPFYPWQPA